MNLEDNDASWTDIFGANPNNNPNLVSFNVVLYGDCWSLFNTLFARKTISQKISDFSLYKK